MTNDYDELIRQPYRLSERNTAIRVVRRGETYAVEYSHIHELDLKDLDLAGPIDDNWQLFGGSVGYKNSTFETEDEAIEFYDTVAHSDEPLSKKYPKIATE